MMVIANNCQVVSNNLSHCPLDAVGEEFVGELTRRSRLFAGPSESVIPDSLLPFRISLLLVVGWSPSHPPVDFDPRGGLAGFSVPFWWSLRDPKKGPKIGQKPPLRCKVQGGWGGSAHYPDPTAQSA